LIEYKHARQHLVCSCGLVVQARERRERSRLSRGSFDFLPRVAFPRKAVKQTVRRCRSCALGL
jgi:hypothetical protein